MQELNATIITIGDELLIGQTIDTNSAYIAQEFNRLGIWIKKRIAVGDVYEDIWQAMDAAAMESDVIVITGGLGPTADDITKPLLSKYFNSPLVLNEAVLKHIEQLFTKMGRKEVALLERNRKQAEVPVNCKVLHNEMGTAPGMWFEKTVLGQKKIFVSLPGVPFEMKYLIQHEVLKRLQASFTFPTILHRTALTAGIGESVLAERLQEFEAALPSFIKLAYLPSFGMVRLRLTGRSIDENVLTVEIEAQFNKLLHEVNDVLASDSDIPMEVIIGELLKEKNKTVATAESCTGGYVAHLITSIPGSSAYFKGAIVSYANEVKEKMLQVSPTTLATVGAVSEETVIQMVKGALQQINTDYAIATSGIMGPAGGTAEKPVGTVWMAVGNKQKVVTKRIHLRFSRDRNIKVTAIQALNLLRTFVLEEE